MWICQPYSDDPLLYLRDLICIHDPMEFFLSCGREHVQECISHFISYYGLGSPKGFNDLVSSNYTLQFRL